MNETANNEEEQAQAGSANGSTTECCYNQVLDDEIRLRLDKLNALSDLINSLERQFDEANSLFRDTLKCSTSRLSTIAKTLGSKSIRQGRIYHEIKLSVEQNQTDCQKACVQFEQANKEHQIAKEAIREAELKLLEANGSVSSCGCILSNQAKDGVMAVSMNGIDMQKLKLTDVDDDAIDLNGEEDSAQEKKQCSSSTSSCDTNKTAFTSTSSSSGVESSSSVSVNQNLNEMYSSKTTSGNAVQQDQICETDAQETKAQDTEQDEKTISPTATIIKHASILSEELNHANTRLIEAEKKRRQSERYHLDQANKLMIAQEKLTKLEREHGQSIRRSKLYFDEAKKFDAKLNSVKGDISRISEDILAAKQAYAQTLSELEQFSDDLHDSSHTIATN